MRTVSPAIAGILEQLELDQPRIVTRADIDRARGESGTDTSVDYAIRVLIENGWLLTLRTRGVWEFAPAARAGAHTAGDTHIELRAHLVRKPHTPVIIAAESAAWHLGLGARPPTRHVLAAPADYRVPPALSGYRIIRHQPRLPSRTRDGLPVMSEASLLTSMAARPSTYRDWPNVAEWLGDIVGRYTEEDLRVELESQPRSVWMRTCYLISRGGDTDTATRIRDDAPEGTGPYFLGTNHTGTYDRVFSVVDSLLAPRAR
ncbi:MAG: type IV toxin-antitoxin system AbiEi family antitoxin [Acidimicrobiia bacterium]